MLNEKWNITFLREGYNTKLMNKAMFFPVSSG